MKTMALGTSIQRNACFIHDHLAAELQFFGSPVLSACTRCFGGLIITCPFLPSIAVVCSFAKRFPAIPWIVARVGVRHVSQFPNTKKTLEKQYYAIDVLEKMQGVTLAINEAAVYFNVSAYVQLTDKFVESRLFELQG